jgi:hypothetical protein
MTRGYLDEHLGDFRNRLVGAGHDVVFAGDAGRDGRTDAWHFRQAIDDGRVILTLDKGDFRYLHQLWATLHTLRVISSKHAGVLTAAQSDGFTHLRWLEVVEQKLLDPDSLQGMMLRWIPGQRRWKEEAGYPED